MTFNIKTPKMVQSLMKSKMALYVLVALSLVNLLGYMMSNCVQAVVFFMLSGAVAYGFTQNMVAVLATSLVFTTMFATCSTQAGGSPAAHNAHHYVEGMENGKDADADADKDATSSDTTDPKPANMTETECGNKTGWSWDTEGKTCKENSEKSTENMTTVYKKNNRVDYAATVEDAYDDLNKILGGDGMKSLTADTQSLVKNQKDLTEAMKSMEPMVGQASKMMESMGGKEGLGKMLKQFGGMAGKK